MKNTHEIKENYKREIRSALNDLKTPHGLKKQIPNMLTASRLLSPLLIIPAALTGNLFLASSAALAFGITDMFDGALARRWNAKSNLGADLDALTDKVFAGTLLISGAIFNPYLIGNIILEAIIAGINIKQKISTNVTESTKIGKLKTWALFGLGALGLLGSTTTLLPVILPRLAVLTAAMQGLTIYSYLKKYEKVTPKQVEKEVPKIESEKPQQPVEQETKSKRKALYYQSVNKPTNVIVRPTNQLDQLREASSYLHQLTEPSKKIYETSKVLKKNK